MHCIAQITFKIIDSLRNLVTQKQYSEWLLSCYDQDENGNRFARETEKERERERERVRERQRDTERDRERRREAERDRETEIERKKNKYVKA